MSWEFSSQDTASFKVKNQNNEFMTLKGISGTESNANTICNGVASLLAVASITGYYEGAIRTVNEDVVEE